MAALQISEMNQLVPKSGLLVPVVDMSLGPKQKNGFLTLSQFNIGSGAGPSAGFYVGTVLNKEVAASNGSTASFMIYEPTDNTKNALLHTIQIKQGTLGGGQYHYEVYAGNPASAGRLLFSSAKNIGTAPITESDYVTPYPILVLADQAGSNEVWLKVYQQASYKMVLNVRATITEFVGLLASLPGYSEPPRYNGPLKMEVYVGPQNGEFEEPNHALAALAPNGTMFIEPGTYFLPFGMGGSVDNLRVVNDSAPNAGHFEVPLIKGAGAYKTIFNGRGGWGRDAGHQFKLFNGKGVAYLQCPAVFEDCGFIGGGGADLASDGEAGTYIEWFAEPATAIFRRCSWDWNENGLFIPDNSPGAPGENVSVRFEECDFGLRRSNGQSGDGRDHNFYLSCDEVEVINCHGYGTVPGETYVGYDAGNTYKSRAKKISIIGGYCESGAGRWLDRPKGGETLFENVILSQRYGANGNAYGYANETDPNDSLAQGAHDTYFRNCSIYISRYASTIWNNRAGTTVYFENSPIEYVQWVDEPTKPSLSAQGPGDVVGIGNGNNPPKETPYALPPPRPGSIAQLGYVPSWP